MVFLILKKFKSVQVILQVKKKSNIREIQTFSQKKFQYMYELDFQKV